MLQYAVASGSMAAVNKPLLRLELCVSKCPTEVQKTGDRNYSIDNNTYTAISEYNKAELDILIAEMDAIGQVCFFLCMYSPAAVGVSLKERKCLTGKSKYNVWQEHWVMKGWLWSSRTLRASPLWY